MRSAFRHPVRGVLLCIALAIVVALILWQGPSRSPEPPAPRDEHRLPGGEPILRPMGIPTSAAVAGATAPRIVVEAPDGRPLAGVRVGVVEKTNIFLHAASLARMRQSESDGAVVLEPGDPGENLLFLADGFLAKLLSRGAIYPDPRTGIAHVRLEAGRSVECVVTDPGGSPIEGARVEARGRFGEALSIAGLGSAGARSAADLRSGVSDRDGRVTISGIAAFPVDVKASKVDHLSIGARLGKPIQSMNGERVHVMLAPILRIGIAVLDDATGLPIGTADVSVREFGGYEPVHDDRLSRRPGAPMAGWTPDHAVHGSAWAPIGTAGPPSSVSPPAAADPDLGGVRLEVTAFGYRSEAIEVTPARPGTPGAVAPTVIRLVADPAFDERAPVRFRIDGPPAEPPRVVLLGIAYRREHDDRPLESQCTLSLDERGFCATSLPLGSYEVRLRGSGVGFTLRTEEAVGFTVRRGATTDVALRVPCARVRARITDERGTPLPDFLATVSGPIVGKSAGVAMWIQGGAFAGSDPWLNTRADRAVGTVDLIFAPGSYSLGVSHPGFEGQGQLLDLKDGDDRRLDIRLVERTEPGNAK